MEINISYLQPNKKEITIEYDYINSPFKVLPFKDALLMYVSGKICYLGFVGGAYKSQQDVFEVAKKSFKNINVNFIQKDLSSVDVFSESTKNIMLIGTPFQLNVWTALLKVKAGTVISYEALSKTVEGIDKNKNYTRATSNAVANNKISYIVPCHRIISKSGSINKYLWGVEVKKKILEHEGISF